MLYVVAIVDGLTIVTILFVGPVIALLWAMGVRFTHEVKLVALLAIPGWLGLLVLLVWAAWKASRRPDHD